jgi:hypothetical protein
MSPTNRPSTTPAVRNKFLVNLSVFLAVWFEVLLMEPDVVYELIAYGHVALALATKAVCLTLILSPLMIYVRRDGLRALKCVWGRVTLVVVIVVARLTLDFLMIWGHRAGG